MNAIALHRLKAGGLETGLNRTQFLSSTSCKQGRAGLAKTDGEISQFGEATRFQLAKTVAAPQNVFAD